MKDIEEVLKAEAAALLMQVPADDVGMMRLRLAEQWALVAKERPDPAVLWLEMWYEGEVCCLFADSNLGKSILAVQIAQHIAGELGKKVLYFDFELSDKQFQLRYTDAQGNVFHFSPLFVRAEINRESLQADGDFEETLMGDIEQAGRMCNAEAVIIDNLTWMCAESEKGGDAANLMRRLMQMKSKYGWSILVIAHTPKRNMANPITQNDLAGSKKIYNFLDSCFAIGRSAKDENVRYIKQVKCRYGAFSYGGDNVITCTIEKEGAFTRFVMQGHSTERGHLRRQTDEDCDALADRVKKAVLAKQSYRSIAKECGISLAKVQRIVRKARVSDVSDVTGDTTDTEGKTQKIKGYGKG